MDDPRRLATALAPFREAGKHLLATQARLSTLLAAVTGEVAAHAGKLERLPAAARFTPFSAAAPFNPFAVLPDGVNAANTAGRDGKARARRTDADRRGAPTAAPHSAATGGAGLASAAGRLRRGRDGAPELPPSAAARAAALIDAVAAGAAAQAPAASLPASEQAARTVAAGELIEALLQRHAPPHAAPRAHGIGARAAAANHDSDAASARRTTAASAARAAQAAAEHPAASDGATTNGAAAARGALLAPGEKFEPTAPSPLHATSAPWSERADRSLGETASGLDAHQMEAVALEPGDAVLRSLLDADRLRPATGAPALDGVPPASGARAPTRSPLQRAASRLLATAATGPIAQPSAAAASLHAARQQPAASAPGDGAAGLAENLDRLLREQAWLREWI